MLGNSPLCRHTGDKIGLWTLFRSNLKNSQLFCSVWLKKTQVWCRNLRLSQQGSAFPVRALTSNPTGYFQQRMSDGWWSMSSHAQPHHVAALGLLKELKSALRFCSEFKRVPTRQKPVRVQVLELDQTRPTADWTNLNKPEFTLKNRTKHNKPE